MKTITGFRYVAFLALIFLLTGCQTLGALAPAPTQAAPLTGANASVVGASALALLEKPGEGNFYLTPTSAETGQATPGFAPVNFGREIAYAFSPDRTQLAFLSSGVEGCVDGCLHLLNLRTWQETLKPIALPKEIMMNWPLLTFNADAKMLAIARNDQVTPTSHLMLVDLSQAKLVQQIELEQPVFQMSFTPQGALAVYGNVLKNKLGEGFMRVLLVNGANLQAEWKQDLEMVQYSSENPVSVTDPSQGNSVPVVVDPSQLKFLFPVVAFSPDAGKLYAVPADKNQLVTVDLVQRSVQTAEIQPRKGLLEQMLTSGAGVVYAKMLNGTSKSGLLSPDGSSLYVTGQTYEAVKNSTGDWDMKNTPLGLQAISTRDGTELAKVSNDATELFLSTDGKAIFLAYWKELQNGYSQATTDVLDASTLKVSQRLDGLIQSTRLLDGSLAWLSSNQQADGSYALAIYSPGAENPRSQWSVPRYVFSAWVPIP